MGVKQLFLSDADAVSDLVQFLQRLDRAGGAEVRLRAEGQVLAFFGSTQSPVHLSDPTQLVLVHRAVRLAEPVDEPLDVVVETRAVLDRCARIDEAPWELPVPPVNLAVAWAGVLPPREGWQHGGRIDAASLRGVALQGAARIAEMLPENPGQPLVDAARKEVWSLEIAPGVPAAAAFALDALGFLREQSTVEIARSATWLRMLTPLGEVFVRDRGGFA